MKRKTKSRIFYTVCCFMAWLFPATLTYASDGEYITISVEATDDNGNLKYALDTDDPSAFTDSNEFTILSGTSHTIYVKDAAGNITSQTYMPSSDVPVEADISQDLQENEQRINIDLEIERQNEGVLDYSNYEYLTDEPVEPGTGTVAEKIETDASKDSERIFYTITTKEGEVLYLIVDQGQTADNVYLLDTVSVDDLLVLADGASGKVAEQEKEDNLFAALSKEADSSEKEENKESNSSNSNLFIIIFVLIIGGGAYYYFKIYKNKKDESMDIMDAMDIEDFEPDEEEEADFGYDDEVKEEYLANLIGEDDKDLYDADPDEYADSEDNSDEYADLEVNADGYALGEEEEAQEGDI